MAEATVAREGNFATQFATLHREILETFQRLYEALERRKQDLLVKLSAMKTAHDKNTELEETIKQLGIAKEKAINAMKSNLLGEELDLIKAAFDTKIAARVEDEGVFWKFEFDRISLFD